MQNKGITLKGMEGKRECPTSETLRRISTTFGPSDFWDFFGELTGIAVIGSWYSRQPLTNHK